MDRTLLVTNDFPPRTGGIQSYLHSYCAELPADRLRVYTSTWRGEESRRFDADQPYPVERYPGGMMVPTPAVIRRVREIVRSEQIDTVWFGAAAPLAAMAPLLGRHGPRRIVASTHGHEVGWSMAPGTRNALRVIGNHTDAITYVSKYTRDRFVSAFGPRAALEWLPGGVDTARFRPDASARAEIRLRYQVGDAPLITCISRLVPRKGQDTLIQALPQIQRQVPGARLLIVGGGPHRDRLHALARALPDEGASVGFTGSVSYAELPAYFAAGDVFAMPCRTRGYGLDVEGLGIVFLEASASGIPVVAGDSGGAPETVVEGRTGTVVPGGEPDAAARAIARLLADPDLAARWGRQGREWAEAEWTWKRLGARLGGLLTGKP